MKPDRIVLYADEFDCDVWAQYCDICGVDPSATEITIYFNSSEDIEAKYQDEDEFVDDDYSDDDEFEDEDEDEDWPDEDDDA